MSQDSSLARRRKIAAVLGLAALALIAVAARARAHAKEEAMLQAVARMRETALSLPHLREAPYGETANDRAWPHYLRALQEVKKVKGLDALEKKLWGHGLSRPEKEGLVAHAETALESLRRGAAAGDAKDIRSPGHEIGERSIRLVTTRSLACLGLAKAELLLEAGRPSEAVRVLLDVQQLGADFISSHMIITEAIGSAFVCSPDWGAYLLEDEHFGMLDGPAKELWVTGLRKIAAGIPQETRSFRGHALKNFELVRASFEDGSFDRSSWADGRWTRWLPDLVWRSAFAAFMVRTESIASDMDAAYRLPRPEVVPEVARVMERYELRPMLFSALLRPRMESLAQSRLENLTRLDMLRHALCVEAGIPDPVPERLNAAPIKVERRAGQVIVSTENGRSVPIQITVGAPAKGLQKGPEGDGD